MMAMMNDDAFEGVIWGAGFFSTPYQPPPIFDL